MWIAVGAVAAMAILLWFIFANFYGIENPDHTGHFPWLGAGLLWIAVGVLTWQRWPSSRTGRLMVLVGFSHFLYAPGLIPTAGTWLLGALQAGFELLLVAYVVLSFPTGRLTDAFDRRLFRGLVVWWIVSTLLNIATDPHHLNPLFVVQDESLRTMIDSTTSRIGAAVLLFVAIRVVMQWRAAPPAERSLRTPLLFVVAAYVVVQGLELLDVIIGPNVLTDLSVSWPGGLTDYGFPLAMVWILWRTRPTSGEIRTAESGAA